MTYQLVPIYKSKPAISGKPPKIVFFSPLLGVIYGKSGKIVDLNNVDNKDKK